MKRALAFLFVVALGAAALAQDVKNEVLRPPKGAKVALVAFEDLECPDCGRAEPLLEQAVATYHIPLVRHDFLIPSHKWSRQAAIIARFFDSKSPETGEQFRRAVYKGQALITPENLRLFVENFAKQHKIDLPFLVDPDGKLAAEVDKDKQIGIQIGIDHTPTIYVVTANRQSEPFVEVVDRSNLFSMIDQAIKETGGTSSVTRTPRKAPKKTK